MRFIVLGTTEFTLSCARALIDSNNEIVGLVSMPKHALPLNSADLEGFAKANGISYYEVEEINSPDTIELLGQMKPDYILSSWPKIIERNVLEIPQKFCIGSHPTALPYNRGRHPLHWLIALGHTNTKLSFFKMDEGIDSGNILAQIPFRVERSDDINKLATKMNLVAYKGLKKLADRLKREPMYQGKRQSRKEANYWRKRTEYDSILDLRMPGEVILRLVRSFSPPFPCAKLIFKDTILPILQASQASRNLSKSQLLRIEPGKIIGIKGRKIRVKTDDSIIELESAIPLTPEILQAKYIYPPTKYICDWSENLFNATTSIHIARNTKVRGCI